MSDIKFLFAGEDSELQRQSVPMLARCFEEWQLLQTRNGNRFPFREISFVAMNEHDDIVGHVGIMPFDILDGNHDLIRMAGIASVGTAPEYRGRGIAAQLCNNAAAWAQEQGFDAMPLYTSFNRVYESCGWKNYPMRSIALSNPAVRAVRGKKGVELNPDEKRFIIECYNSIPEFAGKAVRTEDHAFHGWVRLFNDSAFEWFVAPNGYAAAFEGVLAEFHAVDGDAAPLVCGFESAFLSPDFPAVETLATAGWQLTAENQCPPCWHGENVMVRVLAQHRAELFYSLTDKF